MRVIQTKPDPTLVVLRRARVPEDRHPRRIKPGDFFAVIINSKANPGCLPAITSALEDSCAPCWGEVPLAYYYNSVPISPGEAPIELIASLERIEPPGPIQYRRKISAPDKKLMWQREECP